MLQDPQTHEIRYVGQTRSGLDRRLYIHCYRSPSRKNNRTAYVYKWIDTLLRKGLKPYITELQALPVDHLNNAEIYWIAYFKGTGCRLTNTQSGGNGGWEHMKGKPSAFKGKTVTPEARALISSKLKGRKLPEQTRRKMSVARQRDREKISEKTKQAWRDGKYVGAPRPALRLDPITCPDCGRVCRGQLGLGNHRRAHN